MSEVDDADSSDLEELPPSSKLVHTVLKYEGELTTAEIADHTMLPRSTVREAIRRLEDVGAVGYRWRTDDPQQRVYFTDRR